MGSSATDRRWHGLQGPANIELREGGFGHLLRSDQGSADAQVRDVDHENL